MSTNWNATYSSKSVDERSWSQSVPAESLAAIERAQLAPQDPIIDIGGGASLLVDALLAHGHTDVTVLDIAEAALAEARARLAGSPAAAHVEWIAADITMWSPPRQYALWHDRAVFHFLVESAQQDAYVHAARQGVRPGGRLVLATFAPSGPEQCSGLPVQRWSVAQLADRFSVGFDVIASAEHVHTTPWGSTQPFTWVEFLRRSDTP